ncbi:MAG: CBS domain-containing protein [Gammaproteobacteria bacterium]|nr:CBS domain-containing protein [Gammaproteobacteria bacterium]TVQ47920.1 MAG: CBS domain-containing protein [Gammaproteobacteria bacterium]
MKDQPISRIMTPDPVTVTPADTAAQAFAAMRAARCHHLPVVENGVLVGMLGSADLVKALISSSHPDHPQTGHALLETCRVATIMARRLITLPQQATLLDAVKTLARGDIHALPVVAPGHVLAGIVTSTDLVEALRDALVYPIAQDSNVSEAPHASPSPAAAASTALHALYRAVGHYLHSGRGDLEHGRLLQAWHHAREHQEARNTPF